MRAKRHPVRAMYRARRLGEIAARWDTRAAAWDWDLLDPYHHLNEDDAYSRFLLQLESVIAIRSEFYSANGIIDAGCGTGLVLTAVLYHFPWGAGVDISRAMIREARKRGLARAQFIVGDCFELERLCPPAGLVVSRGVLLSHYGSRQAEALLRSARAALVCGGAIAFDFLNAAGRARSAHPAEHKYWFTAKQIREVAHRAGFTKIAILGLPTARVRVLVAH